MAGTDQATKRAVAVIVLLILAASALHGYLPGRQHGAREAPTSSSAALIADVALLTVSIAIVATAVVVRFRHPRTAAAPAGSLPDRSHLFEARVTWRFLLITLGVILAWLLLIALISRVGLHHDIRQPMPTTAPASNPAPSTAPALPPRPESPDSGGNVVGYLAAATAVLLVLVAAATVVASRRPRHVTAPHPTAGEPAASCGPAATESLARAAELGLAEIGDLSREPRDAIIACYATMERQLTNVPEAAPQDFDTPTEVLARAVEHHALHADSAAQLVDLFEEARFSPHVMNEGHRELAVRALRSVLAELSPRGVA
jgi:Domain of unknown function (DUF4129)